MMATNHSLEPVRSTDRDRGARLRAWRRQFHQLPCLSGKEAAAEEAILSELKALGITDRAVGGGPGVVVTIGAIEGPILTVRASIDGLPIQEETGLSCASTVPGVMHACGHDAAIAVLLELAHAFSSGARGRLRLVFQPEEETLTGARKMVDRGALVLTEDDAVCSFHLSPSLPLGRVGIATPFAMAAVDDFNIVFSSGGGHAGSPQTAADPILAAAEIVCRAPGTVRRHVDPREPITWTMGRVHAGSARNVVAASARMEGTLRYFDARAAGAARAALVAELEAIATAHGLSVTHEFQTVVPALKNDPALTALFLDAASARLGHTCVEQLRPSMAADDVACFHERARGVYWLVGCSEAKHATPPLHSSSFDFPEEVLDIAFDVLEAFVHRFWRRRTDP
jgi:amidohydrolase